MPINYSKWDALELSDDSDIEVHPNVDKKSFIRAKQAQIHQERDRRKLRIETLKYERIINDGLLSRIDGLISSLQKHAHDYQGKQADELVLGAMIEIAGNPEDDRPPPQPKGVHSSEAPSEIRYSRMIGHLIDQVKKELEDQGSEAQGDARFGAWMGGLKFHQQKVTGLNVGLEKELAALEAAAKKKITSADIHDGFNASHVKKYEESKPVSSSQPASKKVSTIEQINSDVKSDGKPAGPQNNESPIDPADAGDSDEDSMEITPLGLEFSKLPISDLRASMQFVYAHPQILAVREQDGLLAEAFNQALDSNFERSRQCVHQALLLQYCMQLGHDGPRMFFTRIMTPNHQSKKLFYDDVNNTCNRIKVRTKEMNQERKEEAAKEAAGVEQIQLQAVDPGMSFNITIPSPITEGSDATMEQMEARAVFETFPPSFQRALETGKLDKINEVLGKMTVEEGEDVVAKLSDTGMLSVEDGVVDTTTQEGEEHWKGIQEEARKARENDGSAEEETLDESSPTEDHALGGIPGRREDGTAGTEDPA